MADTPIWPIEGIALDSTGGMVTGSLADVVTGIDTATGDIAAIKAVTDVLPDGGALSTLSGEVTAIKAVTDVLPDAGALSTLSGEVTAIKAVTDALPEAGALTTITTAVGKIDGAATLGLAGTSNSLAYRVAEVEHHFHCRERWVGKLAVQTATDWADDTLTPFVVVSGANAYGTDANDEALVLGTDDTPIIGGSLKFDVGQINVTTTNSTTPWKLRLIYGTGTMAAAIAAGQFTCTMVQVASAAGRMATTPIRMPRVDVDTKIWVQGWNATDNATLSFFVGVHEYPG